MFQPASASRFKLFDYRRREYLQACLEAAKGFMECFLTIDPTEYRGLTFWIMIEYVHSAQLIYRLSLLDDPGWDRAMVRQTANIVYYLEQTASRFQQAHELEQYGANAADQTLFSKAYDSLKTTIPVWNASLEQVGAVANIQSGGGTSVAGEFVDPILMELNDDMWLQDMFMEWGGR